MLNVNFYFILKLKSQNKVNNKIKMFKERER